MTILDLLIKTASGEDTPTCIKYDNEFFYKDKMTYRDGTNDSIQSYILEDLSNLNDEIEIIEEDNKKNNKIAPLSYTEATWITTGLPRVEFDNKELVEKINEVIDKVNELNHSVEILEHRQDYLEENK